MKLTKELVEQTVIQTMSFFEEEVIEEVWNRIKDQSELPIYDIDETLVTLVDITREIIGNVLGISSKE